MAAGASAQQRLDPYALPVRFTANDAVADGRVRHVERQLWGRVLGVPLLIADPSGALREPFPKLGAVRIGAPGRRRRRRNAIKRRRASLPLRRRPGVQPLTPVVRREREIIAPT
jgi:hypothetical protein